MTARSDNRPKVLVYGLAIAGVSTVRALLRHGHDVIAADDTITPERLAAAAELGVELIDSSVRSVDELLDGCSMLCPAPGVPETHPIIEAALACGIEIVSEIELAYRWEQQRPGGPRRMLAITATDGKTTTTKLAVHLLEAAGIRSIDAGNTDTPLVDALDAVDEAGNERYDAFVVECSSFRLAWTPTFRADAAAWLNLQPDHLNWHRSMNAYEAAKAQVFANQTAADVAIGFAEDPIVMAWLAQAPGTAVHLWRTRCGLPSRRCSAGWPQWHHCAAGVAATTAASRRDQRVGGIGAGARDWPRRRSRRCQWSGNVRRSAAPIGTHCDDQRHRLVQRLQGHNAARRDCSNQVVRTNRADRRRSGQGRCPVIDGRRARTLLRSDRSGCDSAQHR